MKNFTFDMLKSVILTFGINTNLRITKNLHFASFWQKNQQKKTLTHIT